MKTISKINSLGKHEEPSKSLKEASQLHYISSKGNRTLSKVRGGWWVGGNGGGGGGWWSKVILECRFGPNLGLTLKAWTKLNNTESYPPSMSRAF